MRLDFKFIFQSLGGDNVRSFDENGKERGDSYAHEYLASRLANWPKAKDKDAVYRYIDLAERLYKNGWLEVERADRRLIQELIEQDPISTVIIQNQLLMAIEKAEEKEAKIQSNSKKIKKVD